MPKNEKFLVWYEDEGPVGPCGQSMKITCSWRELLIFYSFDDVKAFLTKVVKGRKNPRIEPLTGVRVIINGKTVAASPFSPTWDGVDLDQLFKWAEENI